MTQSREAGAQPDRPADVVEGWRALLREARQWVSQIWAAGEDRRRRDAFIAKIDAALNPAASDRAEKMREALELYGLHLSSCEVHRAKGQEELNSAACTC